MLKHGRFHLISSVNAHNFSFFGRRNGGWSRDQNYPRAATESRLGDGISHLAAGAVGEIANWINRFMRRAGGDEHGFAGQVLPDTEYLQSRGNNRLRLC